MGAKDKRDNQGLKHVRKNIILDSLLFIFMLGLAVSGDSDIHPVLGIIVVILVIIHIVWHWKQIKIMLKQAFPKLKIQKSIIGMILILGFVVLLLFLFILFE